MKGVALAALVLAGCQQDNREIVRRIDAISQRIDRLGAAAPAGAPAVAVAGAPAVGQAPVGPDPSKTYAIPTDDLPAVGSPEALVTIVKAYEYACPFCEQARATEQQLRDAYGDKVRFVYAPFVVHPQLATLPMESACAAFKQGKFGAMNDLLWEKAFKTRQFDQANMDALARAAGLDPARFDADETGECAAWVTRHQAVLRGFGVNATPSFFVNGRYLSGVVSLATFKPIIDDELKKAEDRVARGTPAADYYQRWVVAVGTPRL
ncbi:MAG TPA: DsbA family protein [Kofleriaceae bacterium]|nr:DsbA family protein [Kofleriaceae bacterium]